MPLYDPDSEMIQWGLRLLDWDPPLHPEYYAVQSSTATANNDDGYGGGSARYVIADSSNVENDEIIASTLQEEEFSQLAVAQQEDHNDYSIQPPSSSVDAITWNYSSAKSYSPDREGYRGESNGDAVLSTSCSSPGNGEEEYSYSPEYSGEYDELDDEVGKRLNEMISIPHVPRINGEIPSVDEAMSDYDRLSNRLQSCGFLEIKVDGDGNCQFRALSDQLYDTPDRHKIVRSQVVNQLKSHRKIYEGYVPMDYGDYLKKMSKSGEWGDHVTLQAAADSYGVKILVMTSFKDTSCIEILPITQKPKRAIYLSFWAEVHYNSIYFPRDAKPGESTKKKKWWSFGNKH